MLPQKIFRLSALFGAITIVLGMSMAVVYPPLLPDITRGFLTPILAFEFMQSFDEAVSMFGGRVHLINRMLTGHQIDYAFILAYVCFVCSVAMAGWKETNNRRYLFAFILIPLAGVADLLENLQLHLVLDALLTGVTVEVTNLLLVAVRVKFILLAAALCLLSPYVATFGRSGKIFRFCAWMTLIFSVASVFERIVFAEGMGLFLVLCFEVLFLISIRYKKYQRQKQHA